MKRFGHCGWILCLFFLAKGILWLLIPLFIAVWSLLMQSSNS